MASLRKRDNSPYWVMCYRLPDGSRAQRSSGTTDRNAAMQMCLRMESLSAEWDRGKALAALEELARLHGETMNDPTPISEWFRSWRNARKSTWSESSLNSFLAIENRFCTAYGTLTLGRVEKRHVAEYRDNLLGMGRSPKTVKCHIKYIRRVFESAVEAGRIEENPALISTPSPKPSIKQPFSLGQFRDLLGHTTGEMHNLILVAGLTGQRLRDCLELRHEQIDRDNKLIRFRRRKNRDWHVVPLHHTIDREIHTGTGPVFPDLVKLPLTGSRSVSHKFRFKVLPLVGIVQPYAQGLNGNKRVTEYSFHSLRHMLSTELNRIGASAETRMAVVGHDNEKVSAGYTHADLDVARTMLERVVV